MVLIPSNHTYAYVKSSSGCIGLTENPIAFRRWMLSGPELVRLQQQFEREYPENPKYFQNHEQGFATQKTFQQQVRSLFQAVKKMGNPFQDDFPELIKLDSRNCVDESVVTALRSLEDKGIRQYQGFVKNVLEDCTRPIRDPIKKNKLALFKRPQPKAISKSGKTCSVVQLVGLGFITRRTLVRVPEQEEKTSQVLQPTSPP